APGNVPRLSETAMDAWVLAFAFAVSMLSCLVFGLAPALAGASAGVNDALKRSGTRNVFGGRSRMRRALVVAEIASSVILLVGATLLLRSFAALQKVDLGFQSENVLVMETSMPAAGPAGAQQATLVYKKLLQELETVPGVSAVGAVRVPPGSVISSGAYLV